MKRLVDVIVGLAVVGLWGVVAFFVVARLDMSTAKSMVRWACPSCYEAEAKRPTVADTSRFLAGLRQRRVDAAAAQPPPPKNDEPSLHEIDQTMRGLFHEYMRFSDTDQFRRWGFTAGGPFADWNKRLLPIMRDQLYALDLLTRCKVVPGDLFNAAITAMSDAPSERMAQHRFNVELTFTMCFAKPRWTP